MQRVVFVSLWIALVACSRKPPPPPPPATPGDAAVIVKKEDGPVHADPKRVIDHVNGAYVGSSKTYMVVSEHSLASIVGKEILASGGNAADAAIAVHFALAVVFPTAGNLGGGGFAVVRTAPGKSLALDFREVAPAAATEAMYLDDKGNPTDDSLTGHRASGVPGAVAGMWALHQKLGKKPWAELVKPAVALARDGFEIDSFLNNSLGREGSKKRMLKSPASAKQWYANGAPLPTGTKVVQPELAAVLERIAAKGQDGFYKGETAAVIAEEFKRGGGLITEKDLAEYKVEWRTPLSFKYRGHALTSMPPPSSGGIVLAMAAGMLADVELGKLPWHGDEHVHRLAEVWRRGFAVRNEVIGDPKFVKAIPLEKLLSPAYHVELAKTVTAKATPSKDIQPPREGTNTTNLCVVDANGMAIVITTTLNTSFGSGVTVEKGGFLMNNEMDDFTAKVGAANTFGLVQGAANKIVAGKRPLSSMSPTIVEDAKGNVLMLVGAAGGPRIITAVWQALSNVIDFKLGAANAIANPRVHHQHLPDQVRLEAMSVTREVEQALIERGHKTDWSFEKRDFGAANAIVKAPTGWEGAADPRGGGAAVGD
ncbi:MAG: gamma-glutamyltransferase [Myxococcota bacterium]|nr:gamma-glutamyltransferase [Deltaproteobacteria bacterium]MDQ3340186.1 gamma-glutamyltransferase [Myxococcota bacterium]